ncbi:actin-related protein 8 [Cucurbita moschata]|uniref:Actin-related protein 8 n=1 Tax=Cucurbita moschata TaxID=3662 RepID=A0A6J1F205_CUCMO|nr:actin-related protein 8 [Cucurbita moschata]
MATLLRKVWGSVSTRSGLHSETSSTDRRGFEEPPSLGEFDRIPMDILMQILKLAGPKTSAKMGMLCKSWRSLVSDNTLWIFFLHNQLEPWDSVLFGETKLASGYPLETCSSQMMPLSFMKVYSKRAEVPGSVIIDGGSGYCKFGWSKYTCPSGRSPTFLEFGNIESPMYSRLRHFFATIYSRMRVKPSFHPVVVSLPICHYDDTESAKASRQQLKEAIHSVLFDMNVPSVCAVNQATLALYAARRTSGIVVNVGFQVTSIVPILHGKVMRKVGVEVVGLGALKLTGYLRELMQQNNIHFESMYTVRTLKENLCYVAEDYEAELCKDTQASYQAAGEGWFTLSKERFQTGEVLFQPRMGGVRTMGLHEAVALCMDHCHAAELTWDDSWFKTVVLSGGSACLPGLAVRLQKELYGLLPSPMSDGIRVIPPPYGTDTAWFGARLISNLSTFPSHWCITKKQFRRKSKLNLLW